MTTKPFLDLENLSIYLKRTSIEAIKAAMGELDYVIDRDYWIYTDQFLGFKQFRIKCRNTAIFSKISKLINIEPNQINKA
jgi:hypothetical protein